MNAAAPSRPGLVGRYRSRQSGHPSGVVGRIFGRAMVNDTASANDHAIALLGLDGHGTVLEVGFGQGRTAAILIQRGLRVIGVDPSVTMVKQATARNRAATRDGRADLRHGNGVTIPFPDHAADGAVTVHTVYFMPDPLATFTDVARVVRPGGRLVVSCRTCDTPPPPWMDPAVYRIPSTEHLIDMLATAGWGHVEHRVVDDPGHPLHLFVATLTLRPDPA